MAMPAPDAPLSANKRPSRPSSPFLAKSGCSGAAGSGVSARHHPGIPSTITTATGILGSGELVRGNLFPESPGLSLSRPGMRDDGPRRYKSAAVPRARRQTATDDRQTGRCAPWECQGVDARWTLLQFSRPGCSSSSSGPIILARSIRCPLLPSDRSSLCSLTLGVHSLL